MPTTKNRYRPTSLLVGVSLCLSSLVAVPVPAAAAACQAGEAGCVLPVGTAPPPMVQTPVARPMPMEIDDGGGGIGWLPILLGIAALAALYFLFLDGDDDDDLPISP